MAKQAVIQVVKGLSVGCDAVGNMLLVKFSFTSGADASVLVPAHIVFWLLNHLPANQDPKLRPPAIYPQIEQRDWDDYVTPRVLTVNCKEFVDALRMEFELDRKPDMRVLLDRTSVEVLRQFLENYRGSLMDLGLF